jgi:S1-C subfamily serine protease
MNLISTLLDSTSASICPGDSGGPVYKESNQSVIGINSQYIFSDKSGVSYLNTHTRLSEVSDWIHSIDIL